MDEQTLVKSSILEVFKQNGYSDPARMTQRDFDHIGEEIQKKSGILISGTTIRRLANGEFSRLPQIATLNAIANYFDHKTWQDYKTSSVHNGSNGSAIVVDKKPGQRKFPLRYLYIAGAAVIIMAGVYFFISQKAGVRHAKNASFSFRKSTSNDIPNSVIFHYNIDDVQADSFFIQQSWDRNRRVKIQKQTYTLTDIYYEPGYHVAKLIANDSVIRTVDVSIPTDKWFLYAIDNVANYTPEYIKTDSFIRDGKLGVNVQQLKQNNIDISKDKRYHYVYFPTSINVPSDNFKFTTRVRMRPVRNSFCPYIELELYCQRYYMIVRSTKTGCAHEAFLQFGERMIEGSRTDLTPITFDVEQWTDIAITVKDKKAVISINGREVFSTQFVYDTRKLAGLGFISNGLCEVDNVELTAPDGTVMYRNEF